MKSTFLGIDIGGTNTRIGLVSEDLNVLCYEKLKTLDAISSVDYFIDLIKQYILKATDSNIEVKRIIIGIPGTLDPSRRKISRAPNLPNLIKVPLADMIEKAVAVPVVLDKDVNLLIRRDIHKLGLGNQDNVVALYFGTGIGNALQINGALVYGRNGTAGEMGHCRLPGGNTVCACGNVGCIEAYSSGKVLKDIADRLSGGDIRLLFRKHLNEPEVDRFMDFMASVIITQMCIFDPDWLILGGGVISSGLPKEHLLERVRKGLCKPYPSKNMQVFFSNDNGENGIIGAAILGVEQIKKESKI